MSSLSFFTTPLNIFLRHLIAYFSYLISSHTEPLISYLNEATLGDSMIYIGRGQEFNAQLYKTWFGVSIGPGLQWWTGPVKTRWMGCNDNSLSWVEVTARFVRGIILLSYHHARLGLRSHKMVLLGWQRSWSSPVDAPPYG